MKLYTIGFTKTNAEGFFSRLQRSGASKLIDVRLNNVSQLAGFAKRDDLAYFARTICGMAYSHEQRLAPTADMLDAYKKQGSSWSWYETQFRELLRQRQVERTLTPDMLDGGCLLCSEDKPHHCHRRLVAEYLKDHWGNVEIVHL